MSALAQLEELSLEENRISSLDGVENLRALRKLEVGKNALITVRALAPSFPSPHSTAAPPLPHPQLDAVSVLTNLCQLSVEDNLLTSLAPLSALRNLMELYIGNNELDNIKALTRSVLGRRVPR